MLLRISSDPHLPSIGEDFLPLWNTLFGVVGPLGMDRRSQHVQHTTNCRLIEDDHIVHATKCRKNRYTFTFTHDWPTRAFDLANGSVTIDRHNQYIAELAGTLQIS